MDMMNEEHLGSGFYTLTSTQPLLISANDYSVQSRLWFATRVGDFQTSGYATK
jgi:hypothetical protein